mgnify:CR=1 FL=1
MHLRNIRELRTSEGSKQDSSPPSVKRSVAVASPQPSPLSIGSGLSGSPLPPASPLPNFTLNIDEYLNQLAGKHDATVSAKMTAHLSVEELKEQLESGEEAVADGKVAGKNISVALKSLRELETAIVASLEEDSFAERMIRHQQSLIERARAERSDPSKRETNLEEDVKRLERQFQRSFEQLAAVQTKRNADHDSFMSAFKAQARLILGLEQQVAQRLQTFGERTSNMRRSLQLVISKAARKAELPPESTAKRRLSGRRTDNGGGASGSRRTIRSDAPRSRKRPVSGRNRASAAHVEAIAALEREKAASVRTNKRLMEQNKELQRKLADSTKALREKEDLIAALRRQQKQKVLVLQQKIIAISKQLHKLHQMPEDEVAR